jgi:predicted  nucleic acid-binding Zn-ribbon protein
LVDETEQLRALMEADRWIDRVSSQREHLVEIAELSALEGDLRGFAKDLQEAKAAQNPVRSAYEAAQHDTERLSTRARDLEKRLTSLTANARELAAIHTELEHVRQLLSSAEDLELGLLIDVEPLDEAVGAIKAHAQPGLARRGELQATIAQLQSTLDEEITSLRVARVARADALSPDLLKRYQGVMSRVGVAGAALVEAGRCDGCRIALSPLDVDRWKAQAPGTFMACPECGRLLLP